MIIVKKVIRVDFDNEENNESKAVRKIEIFRAEEGEDGLTASLKIKRFLDKFEHIHPYKGWNDQIYPQFVIEK